MKQTSVNALDNVALRWRRTTAPRRDDLHQASSGIVGWTAPGDWQLLIAGDVVAEVEECRLRPNFVIAPSTPCGCLSGLSSSTTARWTTARLSRPPLALLELVLRTFSSGVPHPAAACGEPPV
jgi:hypothetical protein